MKSLASKLPLQLRRLRTFTTNHVSSTMTSPGPTMVSQRTISHGRNAFSSRNFTVYNHRSTAHKRIQHHSSRSSTSVFLALHPTQPLLKQMPQKPKPPPDEDFEEYFLKGSGPGGQKINKTNSAVQLLHKATGIVVKSQATRSRSQNRTIARQLLADKLDNLEKGDKSRAAIVGSVKAKKKASSAKKARRKYRKLEEDKAEAPVAASEGESESKDSQPQVSAEMKVINSK